VLRNARVPAKLQATLNRGGKSVDATISMENGFLRNGDFSWRPSSWSIRQWAGGMLSEEISDVDKRNLKLKENALALNVKHVGAYAPHNIAKAAGLLKDDVIIEVNGMRNRMSESELLAYIAQKTKPGDKFTMTVLRAGKEVPLKWVLPPPKE
jgi:serine protease Do